MSPVELQAHQMEALQRKAKLEEKKAKDAKNWTEEEQDALDELVMYLVDVEELLEAAAKTEYVPDKGTEKLLHLVISETRRFDPKTGKSLNRDRKQLFSYSEWRVFKKNFTRLGYIIVKVLHDPYNEAHEFVAKED